MKIFSHYRDAATKRYAINLGKLFGACFEPMPGSNGKWYLAIVVWIPRDLSGRRLRYFYPFNRYGLRWPAPRVVQEVER